MEKKKKKNCRTTYNFSWTSYKSVDLRPLAYKSIFNPSMASDLQVDL